MENEMAGKGLKKRRVMSGKTPEHSCSNCKCKRYTPCRCMKAVEDNSKTDK